MRKLDPETSPVYPGIYTITSSSGKRYIGSSVNIHQRWVSHKRHLVKGTHHCQPLQRAWSKYGPGGFVFSVLERVDQVDLLFAREEEYLQKEKPEYNTNPHARGSRGRVYTDEQRARMSIYLSGQKRSPEVCAAMSARYRGRVMSEESKEKKRRAMLGKVYPPEVRQKVSEALRGHAVSDAAKQKMRDARLAYWSSDAGQQRKLEMAEAQRGKTTTPERRQKLSMAVKDYWKRKREENATSDDEGQNGNEYV